MMGELDQSYARCERLARRAARNFYYSFLLLPRPRRRAMCALYAFLRETDDLCDNDQPLDARRAALDRWRRSLDRALRGQFDQPILPALADTVARYRIDPADLHAVLDGMEMDLARNRYETFDELVVYCQRVASAVGLACLAIWGCHAPQARQSARDCGIALQLTNILRDLREDLERGRVYLPQEDLRRFECDLGALGDGAGDARFRALMRFEIERTEGFYREGARLEAHLPREARAVFWTMMHTYRALLEEIKRRDGDVLGQPIRLTSWHKWRLAAQGLLVHSRAVARWRGALGG
jgi:phytoene synthase